MGNNEIMVSIVCNTYNHEKYIADALDGFVSQKTNFPIEILVMDDASTDGTADIIREYEKKYPEIIKPIYQTENQYSRGLGPVRQNRSRAKGKYIALCEGDDYWIDEHKLQKQVDYMEAYPECMLCLHRVKVQRLIAESNNEACDVEYLPELLKQNSIISAYDIITSKIHFQTSSFVIRTHLFEDLGQSFVSNGTDYILLTRAAMEGTVYFMADVMSVYNKGVSGSWTLRAKSENNNLAIKNALRNIESLQAIRNYYGAKNWLALTVAIYKQKCRLSYAWGYPTKNLLVKAACFLFKIWNKMTR